MKRIFMFLLLFIPNVIWADACTNPNEYTIDKRCYVKDKNVNPYNAIVSFGTCAGTIVKDGDDFYLYTARHCLTKENTKGKIRLANGFSFKPGDLMDVGENDANDDWAIFKIDQKDLSKITNNYTQISDKDFEPNARSVGYGSLKILSDEQLGFIKKEYVYFLQTKHHIKSDQINLKTNANVTGIIYDGIHFDSDLFREFLSINDHITIYESGVMKTSKCSFSTDASQGVSCQMWHGDSGGGVFDADGKLLGIISHGYPLIGGPYHASGNYEISTKPDFIFPVKNINK